MKLRAALFSVSVLVLAASGQPTRNQTEKLTPDAAGGSAFFGFSVSVAEGLAAVGAAHDASAAPAGGAVYLYDRTDGTMVRKITLTGAVDGDGLGNSVSLSGELVLSGATGVDLDVGQEGAAFVFDASSGAMLHRLTAADERPNAAFGQACALSGRFAVIGAERHDEFGNFAGAAYVFDAVTGSQLLRLTAPQQGSNVVFGRSVAIDGALIVVGADGALTDGIGRTGAAYVFDPATGGLLRELIPSRILRNAKFGSSVSISGNLAVVGASEEDGDGADECAVYVFDAQTGEQIQRIVSPDAEPGARFGSAVSVSGDCVFVTAREATVEGFGRAGAAYLFRARTGELLARMLPSDTTTDQEYGFSAALSGGDALVGTFKDDQGGSNAGAVYLFATPPFIHFYGFGVNDEGIIKPLAGDRSVREVANALNAFRPCNVRTNVFGYGWDPELFDPVSAINATMNAAVGPEGPVKPGDTVVIHIATHGTYLALDPLEGDEAFVCQRDNPNVPFACTDRATDELLVFNEGNNGTMLDDELHALFDTPEWHEVNKLFIIDSCFAGGFWGTDLLGDTGDLATIPRTGLIAAAPESKFSYGELTAPHRTYLSIAIATALEELAAEPSITFGQLAAAVEAQENLISDAYTDSNGEFAGILVAPVDFSPFYGSDLPADFDPVCFATPDFELNLEPPTPCGPADLAAPFGVLDLADIVEFINAFVSQTPSADFDSNGVFDLADIVAFVEAFNAGCP